jgi:hypothetical protein
MPKANKTLAECPRCGYDLTGQVDSWAESCPLHGVCTECGLRLEYGAILNWTRAQKWQFFEIAESGLARTFFITARRALRPRRFWNWVRMEHPPNLFRMWTGAIVGCLTLYVPLAMVWAVVLAVFQYLPLLLDKPLVYYRFDLFKRLTSNFQHALLPGEQSFYFSGPLKPLWIYAVLGAFVTFLTPLCFLCLPDTLRAAKVRRMHLVRITAWSTLAIPLLLQSLHSSFQVLQPAEYLFRPYQQGSVLNFARSHESRIFVGLVLLWLLGWWFFACRDYLKLPKAIAIAASMIVMALLFSILLTLFIPGATVPLLT